MGESKWAAFDAIKPRQFIAVVEEIEVEEVSDYFGFGRRRHPERLGHGDGLPLLVRAVDYPFVCVEYPRGEMGTIDVRRWRVKILSPSYVRGALSGTSCGAVLDRRRGKKKSKGTGDDPRICPRCKEARLQRRYAEVCGRPHWIAFCPNCGLEGRPVECD